MADLAGPLTNAGARRFLARWDRRFHSLQSRVARYGLAIVSVTVALRLTHFKPYPKLHIHIGCSRTKTILAHNHNNAKYN